MRPILRLAAQMKAQKRWRVRAQDTKDFNIVGSEPFLKFSLCVKTQLAVIMFVLLVHILVLSILYFYDNLENYFIITYKPSKTTN